MDQADRIRELEARVQFLEKELTHTKLDHSQTEADVRSLIAFKLMPLNSDIQAALAVHDRMSDPKRKQLALAAALSRSESLSREFTTAFVWS